MATEQGLYAQVVMIRRKDSEYKKGKEKENTNKYNFQIQSERLRRLFDLDHEWLEENSRTHKPDYYKHFIRLNLGVMIPKKSNIWSIDW